MFSAWRKMTGIEFILSEVLEPHLFVIRKQARGGPEKVTPHLTYYILDGSIYQAPQLFNVFASRVVSIPTPMLYKLWIVMSLFRYSSIRMFIYYVIIGRLAFLEFWIIWLKFYVSVLVGVAHNLGAYSISLTNFFFNSGWQHFSFLAAILCGTSGF